MYLNLGLANNGRPQHDPSWATSRYIQIMRIQKVIQEFEVILAQNKIEEKRTLIQVKCVSKWIADVKDKSSLAQNLAAKLTILRRDFFNENDTESQSGEIAKEIKVTGQKTAYESRASLDGKILYMVLAHPDHIDDLEKYI